MLKTARLVHEIFSLMRCWGKFRQQIYRIPVFSFYIRAGMSVVYFSFVNVLVLHISAMNINVQWLVIFIGIFNYCNSLTYYLVITNQFSLQ